MGGRLAGGRGSGVGGRGPGAVFWAVYWAVFGSEGVEGGGFGRVAGRPFVGLVPSPPGSQCVVTH